MAEWDIHYLPEIEKSLDKLDNMKLKSLSKEMRLLELMGNLLRLPHSRALKAGLFELRERTYGLRVYYTFDALGKVILLYLGDKNHQDRDIERAYKLLEKYRGKDDET